MSELLRRFRMLLGREKFDRELDEEMRLHRELKEQELKDAGVAAKEAGYRARREIGNTLRLREESRAAWGWGWPEDALQDVRYGLRMLRKSPGFAAVAVMTLALGIGANTSIFSIINSVLLRPLAFPDSQQLVRVTTSNGSRMDAGTTLLDFFDWRTRNRGFQGLAASWQNNANLLDNNGPEKVRDAIVTADLFSVMGVQPILGQLFRPADDRLGYEHIVLLSYGFWQRRYGGDPAIIGKQIAVDSTSFTIAGVLPRGFHFPGVTDLWLPMGVGEEALIGFHDNRRIRAMDVVGRLKAGMTIDRARADMNIVTAQLAKEYPATNGGWSVQLVPLEEDMVGASRKGLFILMGAAGFVLLIACANLASLLLARGAVRAKEFSIRGALGGSRTRLVRQVVTESMVLGLLGGLAGVFLAYASQAAILAWIPPDLPRLDEIHLDGRALAFTLALSVWTSIAFGLVPALQATKVNLQAALKAGGRQAGGDQSPPFRKALIIGEIAGALVLTVGAALLMESFLRLLRVRPGYNPQNVITGTVGFPDSYPTPKEQIRFAKQVIARLKGVPGVRDVAGTSLLPLINFKRGTGPVQIVGEAAGGSHEQYAQWTMVTPEFFQTMQVPLLSGRTFTEAEDAPTSGPIVINLTAARLFWPDQNPIGKHLKFLILEAQDRQVIGVVGDVKQNGLAVPCQPEIYVPFYAVGRPYVTFILRTERDPGSFARTLADEVHKVDSTFPVYDVQTLEQLASESLNPNRFYLRLLGAFGLTALMLAAVGIYGLVSFSVAQRTQELGIRMTLGALPSGILRMIMGQALWLTIVGLAFGILGAAILTRFISSLLFGVTPTDPVTLALASALIVVCAMAASYIPARRAMRLEPTVALRDE
jgi:putative ABC transport system permease protein